ncbi:MAG: hypothetical protein ABH827_07010 [bacterium]
MQISVKKIVCVCLLSMFGVTFFVQASKRTPSDQGNKIFPNNQPLNLKLEEDSVGDTVIGIKKEIGLMNPEILSKFLQLKQLSGELGENGDLGPIVNSSGVLKGLEKLKNLRVNGQDSDNLAQILKKFIKHFKGIVQNSAIGQKNSIYTLVSFVLDEKITSSTPKSYGSFMVKVMGSLVAFVSIVLFAFEIAKNFYVPLKDYAFISDAAYKILPIFVFIVGTKLFWDQCCSCCSSCNPFIEEQRRRDYSLLKAAKEQWDEFGDEIGIVKEGLSLVGLLNKQK